MASENMYCEVAPARVLFMIVSETIRSGSYLTEAFPNPCTFTRWKAFQITHCLAVEQQPAFHIASPVSSPSLRAASSSEIQRLGSSSLPASI